MDEFDRRLLNRLQHGLPLEPHPYALLAGWPQVAHNYRREHALNMWLVVACDSPAEVAETLARLERESGLAVLDLPKEATYHVGLHFPL